jgi:Uma2 family endonuclease
MASASVRLLDDDEIRLTRAGIRFPIELRPRGLRPADPTSWPSAEGRLEYVNGKLLYMPPCADTQQYVAVDVVFVLRGWALAQPEFVVGANEAGMKLGADVRAADAAVWRRADVGAPVGRIQHVAPVLAVEVAGTDEEEAVLREKANWYREHGVAVIWLVLPETREVIVVRGSSESRHASAEQLPELEALPGLRPDVAAFFTQL